MSVGHEGALADQQHSRVTRPPPNDEGPTVAAVGLQEVDQSVSHHCAPEDALRKEFETWRAKLAFRDYSLSRTDAADGAVRYYVGRFGLIKELADLDAVAAFARKAGAV